MELKLRNAWGDNWLLARNLTFFSKCIELIIREFYDGSHRTQVHVCRVLDATSSWPVRNFS